MKDVISRPAWIASRENSATRFLSTTCTDWALPELDGGGDMEGLRRLQESVADREDASRQFSPGGRRSVLLGLGQFSGRPHLLTSRKCPLSVSLVASSFEGLA